MYKAIILPLAKQDIKDAADWYNTKQNGLGTRFTKTVREKTRLIQQHPKISAIRYEDVRIAVLDVFPFTIHYTVAEQEKSIVISLVAHTSLNPDKWTQRK